jgi:hypothetical protein
MRNLLTLTAAIEMGSGAPLICCPSTTVELLLGSGLDTSAAVTVGRVAAAVAAPGYNTIRGERRK